MNYEIITIAPKVVAMVLVTYLALCLVWSMKEPNYYNNESPSLSLFWFLVKVGFIALIYILTMGAIYYS